MAGKRTSIYTLSKELNISPSTVSRALNNHPDISAEVRAKVQQVAEDRNFRPRFVSNKVTNVCVLIQQLKNHPLDFDNYLARTMEGVAEYCRHEGLEMSIYSSDVQDLNQCDIVRELRRREADAAIVLRATGESDFLMQMEAQRFPYFCLFDGNGQVSDKIFKLDNEALLYGAVRYLISLGHRRIGMIRDRLDLAPMRARYEGYCQALQDAGLGVDASLVSGLEDYPEVPSGGGLEIGARGIEALLSRKTGMTAVVTTGDMISRSVLGWLYANDVKVPQQISVMGFDDYPEMQWLCPALTTIRVPYKEIGYEGARQVHRLVRGLDVLLSESVVQRISGELIVRKSTGPVVG